MEIEDYFRLFRASIVDCPWVDQYSVEESDRGDYEGFIRAKIYFADDTILHVRECVDVRAGIFKHLYVYHYGRSNGSLIFRYDNTRHHLRLRLKTFPHHKHVDSESNVIESQEPDLTLVLGEIEKLIFSVWRTEIVVTGTSAEPVYDSASSWVKKHIDNYVATDGQTGHEWRPDVPTLLLTVRGRKSGKLHRTALIYGRDGEDYIVVASRGGASKHPAWYLNLRDNPDVEVQVWGEKFAATASTASAEEKPRLWATMTKIFPSYNDYQAKTTRNIPVVLLKRKG